MVGYQKLSLLLTSLCSSNPVDMFKLIAFFAILAAAFAVPAPEPKPKPDPLTLYTAGAAAPLTYNAYQPIAYSGLGYNYIPYAYNYNYYAPLAYRNLYL